MLTFRVVSVNARGINDDIKRKAIFEQNRGRADILIIQETHGEKDVEKRWRNEWGGEAFYSHGSSAARGIAIFVTKKIMSEISNIYTDSEGRLIIFDLKENDVKITIVAIYAPNKDSPDFLQHWKSF